MNRKYKIFLVILFIGVIAGLLVFQFVYNKSHPDYEKEVALFTLEAQELLDEYRNSNAEANEKYTGTVIQVRGEIDKIEQNDSLTVAVIALSEGLFGDEGIRCTMLPEYSKQLEQMALPKYVVIKGLCVGYNDTDVVMEHCSLK
jgi:uncharacterized protein (DUF1330 family)